MAKNTKLNKVLPLILLPLLLLTFFGGGVIVGYKMASKNPITSVQEKANGSDNNTVAETVKDVLPPNGFQSKISFGDSIIKLEENGVIDKKKMEALYKNRGGMPTELKDLLENPSNKPIVINRDNAQFLINLLWPLGIANKNTTLTESEAGKPEYINDLAATGGWNLGASKNGGDYYNKFEIIKLAPEQDAMVKRMAHNIFRPCCGNSTDMPDCNHGAAMLGLLQLGASQGLSEEELYREALQFNAFWFPENYAKMAIVFKQLQDKSWKDLDPKTLLGINYSSGAGYSKNVALPFSQISGNTSQGSGGGSCST